MNQKILLVEQSATARHVLAEQIESFGFTVEALSDYTQAESALAQSFSSFQGDDIACVVLCWHKHDQFALHNLCRRLESVDHHDLPVIVLSGSNGVSVRSWVGARANTTLLRRRDYQQIPELLRRLVRLESESAPTPNEATAPEVFSSKFSNADINILVVDDSPSIRYALNDLLLTHGYCVSVAESPDEAMEQAREQDFDIAVIDYFLQDDQTGDQLVADLLRLNPESHLACAILTGNYADHLIQRSLRAGAVECMFKNESSELLLARIDAIARMIRQQKQLGEERERLSRLVAGSSEGLVYLDRDGFIALLNPQARALLGYEQADPIEGLSAKDALMGDASLSEGLLRYAKTTDVNTVKEPLRTELIKADGSRLAVKLHCRPSGKGELSLSFSPAPALENAASQSAAAVAKPVAALSASPKVLSDHDQALTYFVAQAQHSPFEYSLLSVQVLSSVRHSKPLPISFSPTLQRAVERALQRVVPIDRLWFDRRSRAFSIVICHDNTDSAMFQAKRIVYNIAQMARQSKQITLHSRAALLPLHPNFSDSTAELLRFADDHRAKAAEHGSNHIYIVERQQVVSVPLVSSKVTAPAASASAPARQRSSASGVTASTAHRSSKASAL